MSNELHQYVNPEWLEHRPHPPEDDRPVTPLVTSSPPCFKKQVAEIMQTGFTIIEYPTTPSEEEIASVLTAFDLACSRAITGSEGPTVHCIGAGESEMYLRTGLEDKWIETFVEREFGVNYDFVFEQDPIIMRGRSGTVINEPRTAHPSQNALSLLRVVKGEIHSSKGQLKLFGVSDHGAWETEPRLTNQHLLVMKGHLNWTFHPAEDTTLIWKGFSQRPMLDDVKAGTAYPFMTFVIPLGLEGDFPRDWLVYPDSSA